MKRIIIVEGGNFSGDIHSRHTWPIVELILEELEELKTDAYEFGTTDTVLTLRGQLREKEIEWSRDDIEVILMSVGLTRRGAELKQEFPKVKFIIYSADCTDETREHVERLGLVHCCKSADLTELFSILEVL